MSVHIDSLESTSIHYCCYVSSWYQTRPTGSKESILLIMSSDLACDSSEVDPERVVTPHRFGIDIGKRNHIKAIQFSVSPVSQETPTLTIWEASCRFEIDQATWTKRWVLQLWNVQLSHQRKNLYPIPLYWLVNRDPCIYNNLEQLSINHPSST